MEDSVLDKEVSAGEKEGKINDVVYISEKDFYKGYSGEFRLKAEGLFKKAKEKGISIEDIDIKQIKERQIEFPGLGTIDLSAFIVTIRGKHVHSGQVMVDGKHIDYYNIYQKYVAEKIEKKNSVRDEKGRIVRENNKPKMKEVKDLSLSEWERFEIGKNLVDDKEFGIEKTITGACERIIRKLMGENDWLYPGEARLLDEEFKSVQSKITEGQENKKSQLKTESQHQSGSKKATDRQINFLKARIKNNGIDPDDDFIMGEIMKQSGFNTSRLNELTTTDMSKIIDSIGVIIPRVKEVMASKVDTENASLKQ